MQFTASISVPSTAPFFFHTQFFLKCIRFIPAFVPANAVEADDGSDCIWGFDKPTLEAATSTYSFIVKVSSLGDHGISEMLFSIYL